MTPYYMFGVACCTAALITYYFIPLLSRVAWKLSIIDNPDGKLKHHKQPTPYLGGVALFLGFITAVALVSPCNNHNIFFILGSILLLFVGLIDDIIALAPHQKWVGQCLATLCFLRGGLYLKQLFLASYFLMGISALWILTVINAFNLVDIMDGLAATLALGATLAYAWVALQSMQSDVLVLLGALAGALLSFLWFNKPPAKIYLGDAGSLFIGGILATIPFMLPWAYHSVYGFLVPPFFIVVPLLEVASLILIRWYYKIPFYQGSPHHFAHFLQRASWNPPIIIVYSAFITVVSSALGIAFLRDSIALKTLILLTFCLFLGWFLILFTALALKKLLFDKNRQKATTIFEKSL